MNRDGFVWMGESSGSAARPRSADCATRTTAPGGHADRSHADRSHADRTTDAQRVAELEQRIASLELEREAWEQRAAIVAPPLHLVVAWPSVSSALGRIVRRAAAAAKNALHHRLSV